MAVIPKEQDEFMTSQRLTLEEMSHAELSAFLEWIYTMTLLSDDVDLALLFRLAAYATMYDEVKLLERVRRSISDFVGEKTKSELCLLLLESGSLVNGLPNEFGDWFVGRLPIDRVIAESLLESSCRIGDMAAEYVAENAELRDEKDAEIDELRTTIDSLRDEEKRSE